MSDASGSSASSVRVGIYWDRAVWDRARSAYVADLSDPEAPDSFTGWLNRAIERHTRLAPAKRAELADATVIAPAMARRFSKSHPLRPDVVAAYEAAIVDDREQLGRLVGRSAFVQEAVLVAAQAAQKRLGRELPPAPGKLPTRPVRRTPPAS